MFDSFGRIAKNAADQLARLTPTARLLVLVTVALMGSILVIVGVSASAPDRVEIVAGTDPSYKSEALTQLRASGIEASINDRGQLMVRAGDVDRAAGLLASQGVVPSDGTLLFKNLSEQMKWTNPREVNQQIVRVALQNELARTISNFPSLKQASVFLDTPQPTGIGMAVRQPTASVTVFSKTGSPITQNQVDAVAKLVSHSVAGLNLTNVSVIDGTTGRPLQARNEDSAIASSYLEHKLKFEREVEQKIRGILSSIPGVTIAVTADVDVKRVTSRREAYLEKGEGTVSLSQARTSTLEEQQAANRGAEAGTRPNTGADIAYSASGAAGYTKEDTTEDMENRVGSEVTSTIDPGGAARSLSISVQLPRGYIEALLPKPEGAAEDEPPVFDDAVVEAKFAAEQARIREMIEPHLPVTVDGEGNRVAAGTVAVSMMPIDLASLAGTAQASLGIAGATAGAGSGSLGGMMTSGLIEKALLGVLAGTAFVMMFFMVRGATKRVALPSVEELVGIPPALEKSTDVVGEADESETPMEGIEVDDSHVASTKMLEQVGDLVGNEPDLAARLLNRWIQP